MKRSLGQLSLVVSFAIVACAVSLSSAEDSEDGVADAKRCISAEDFRMRKLEPGDLSMASSYAGLDVATGLPIYTAVIGLDPDGSARRERSRYVEDFNATIQAHIRQHGLPSSSRKKWITDLNQPTRSFRARVLLARKPSEAQMIHLAIDGNSAASPDRRFALKIETVQVRHGERIAPEIRMVVTAGEREVESISWPAGKVEVFWGADGSDAAYLHWTEIREKQPLEFYASLDLRVGRWIKKQEVKTLGE